MVSIVKLYSDEKNTINDFLSKFYDTNLEIENSNSWQMEFKNPVEIADLIGAYVDNISKFKLTMWICLDNNIYISINEKNANAIIKYLYERFPY
jgi:hypothetical protein